MKNPFPLGRRTMGLIIWPYRLKSSAMGGKWSAGIMYDSGSGRLRLLSGAIGRFGLGIGWYTKP